MSTSTELDPSMLTTIRLPLSQSAWLKSQAQLLQHERVARGERPGKADMGEVMRRLIADAMGSSK